MLDRLRAYLGNIFQDQRGNPSSKRYFAALAWLIVAGSWIANVVWRVVVDSHIIQAAMTLGGVSTAGVAGEMFGKIGQPAPPKPPDAGAHPDKPE